MKIRRNHSKKKELPVPTICRNCGTQTVGRYCHVCGQDLFAGRGQSLVNLLGSLFENAFALDNKTLVSLKYLFFHPGFLSAEYRAGRVVSYVQPVKLFWMSTLIFFALLFSQIDFGEDLVGKPNQPVDTEQAVAAINTMPSGATAREVTDTQKEEENKQQSGEAINIELPGATGKEIKKDENGNILSGNKLKDVLSTYVPYVIFSLIPVFALLLMLFFWRKRFYYMYHLIFAVHFHTFLWIFGSLLIIAGILTKNLQWPWWVYTALVLLPGIYFMIALYRFYQPKRKRTTFWTALFITFIYVILIIAFSVFLAILMTYLFFPELWAEIIN